MATLLFVHAHPDDETIATGLTMAHHVALGDEVHVLTCTLGEQGEVIPEDLAHLEGADGDPLALVRRQELREAMRRLGTHHAVLGENAKSGVLSRFRDSGMAWGPGGAAVLPPGRPDPRAFAVADVGEVGVLVADHIRALRPAVVVTYDPTGGYGHPDHVQAHRVTVEALRRLSATGEAPGASYQIVTPRSWLDQDRRWLHEHVGPVADSLGVTVPGPDEPLVPSAVDDDTVTHVVEDLAAASAQADALRAHCTQLRVLDLPSGGHAFALSNDVARRVAGREAFVEFDPSTGQWLRTPDRKRGLWPG